MKKHTITTAFIIVVLYISTSLSLLSAQESADPEPDSDESTVESAPGSDQTDESEAPLETGEVDGQIGQMIITAAEYFDDISARYAEIEDYQSDIVITQTDSVMRGTLYHKRPDMLLIEFEEPEEQIISADGVTLKIYIPYLNVVMEQELKPHETPVSAGSLATEEGLQMMKEKYSVAYLDSQDYVPLEEDSDQMVRKLKLEWKNIDEGFRELILSVNRDGLIRRIEGITAAFEELTLDFTNIVTNQGLPSRLFVYDSPPSAYAIKNFISEPEE